MIGYLLVLLVVALNMGESIAVKAYARKYNSGGFIMNAIIALFACAFFFAKVLISGESFNFLGDMIPYALVNSAFYFCGFYLAYVAFKIGPFGLTRLIASFSLLMPIFYGIFFLNEPTGVFTYIGIALIVAAMFMMNYKGKSATAEKKEGAASLKWFVCILLSTVSNGFISIMTKMQQVKFGDVCSEEFQIISIGVSFIFLAILGLIIDRNNLGYVLKNGTLYGAISGLFNGAKNFIILFIYSLLPISIVSPLKSGLAIICSFLLSTIAYKEKYSLMQKIGVACGGAAVVILTVI